MAYTGFKYRSETFSLINFRDPFNGKNAAAFDRWIYLCYTTYADKAILPYFPRGLLYIILFYIFGPGSIYTADYSPL